MAYPTDPEIAALLPGMLEVLRGPDDAQFKLGEGNDGTVYQAFDPVVVACGGLDPYPGRLKDLCVKVWKPGFRKRTQEIEVHLVAQGLPMEHAKVPSLVHVDIAAGAFLMECVPGKTAARALFGRRRFPGESLFHFVSIGFGELNKGGVYHNDPHTENWMLTDIEEELTPNPRGGGGDDTIVTDGKLWIIDFGRSELTKQKDDRPELERWVEGRVRKGF